MSAATMIARRGDPISVYRGTAVTAGDGNRSLGAPWTLVSSATRMMLQPVTEGMHQKLFGTAKVVELVGWTAKTVDLVPETDRVLIESGPYVGLRFQVEERQHWDHGTNADQRQFGLVSTTEVFP